MLHGRQNMKHFQRHGNSIVRGMSNKFDAKGFRGLCSSYLSVGTFTRRLPETCKTVQTFRYIFPIHSEKAIFIAFFLHFIIYFKTSLKECPNADPNRDHSDLAITARCVANKVGDREKRLQMRLVVLRDCLDFCNEILFISSLCDR